MNRSAHTLLSAFSVIFGQYSQHHKDSAKLFHQVASQYKRVKSGILELLTGEVIGTPSSTPVPSPKIVNTDITGTKSSNSNSLRTNRTAKATVVASSPAPKEDIEEPENSGWIRPAPVKNDVEMLNEGDALADEYLDTFDKLKGGPFYSGRGDFFSPHEEMISSKGTKVLINKLALPQPLTIKFLFRKCFADGCSWYAKYHERRGDFDRKCDPWSTPKSSDDSDACGWRKATWESIVKAPMKRQVTVTENSCYYFIKDKGKPSLFIHCSSQTKVTLGDTFRTEYLCAFSQENDDTALVTLTVYFKVTFVKSCLLKSKVESAAADEMEKAMDVFKTVLMESCAGLTAEGGTALLQRRASIFIKPPTSLGTPVTPQRTSIVKSEPVGKIVESDEEDKQGESDVEEPNKSDEEEKDDEEGEEEEATPAPPTQTTAPKSKQHSDPEPVAKKPPQQPEQPPSTASPEPLSPGITAEDRTEPSLSDPSGTQYNCALLLKGLLRQGLLLVRPRKLIFTSMLLDSPLEIELSQVMSVSRRKTARIFDNAISINVKNAQEEHFFTSFLSRDAAFNEIMTYWGAVSSSKPPSVPATPTQRD
eukprot:PhF_6_TR40712/c0_g1_i1/m.61218